MNMTKITNNGYRLTDIFDAVTMSEMLVIVNSFVPTLIRTVPNSRREVYYAEPKLHNKVVKLFIDIINQLTPNVSTINAVEFWRDYPLYTSTRHTDDATAQNVAIVYLDSGDSGMGTFFTEDGIDYTTDYITNTGLLLLNSSKIEHGMIDKVTAADYRRVMYINWQTANKIINNDKIINTDSGKKIIQNRIRTIK